MFKSNGGFTLVELVVVIAILAILAGVTIPAYQGYIEKANDAADLVAANAVKTAVFAAYAEKGATPPAKIVITNGVPDVAADYESGYEFYIKDAGVPTDLNGEWNGTTWTPAK